MTRFCIGLCGVLALLASSALAQDRVQFLSPPDEYTAEDAKEAESIRNKLKGYADILLDVSVTGNRQKTIEEESRRLIIRLQWLDQKRRAWSTWQESLANSPVPEKLDYEKLFRIMVRARSMSFVTWTSDLSYYDIPNALGDDDTTPQHWEQIAEDLTPFGHLPFSLKDREAKFLLRAFLVQGKSYLYASGRYLKAGNRKKHLETYEKGIRTLQRVLAFATQAKNSGVLDDVDALPYDMRPFINEQSGFSNEDLGVVARVGTNVGKGTTTSEETQRWLAAACPWGVDNYFFLREAHMIDGLDLGFLEVFQKIRLLEQGDKLYVCMVKPSYVPNHVRRDFQEICGDGRDGRIRYDRGYAKLRWAVVQEPTYSLWVLSPVIYQLKPSELLQISAHIRKIIFGFDPTKRLYGWGGYLCDVTLDLELAFTGWAFGEESGAYAVSRVLVDGNNSGVLDSDLLINYTEKGFNWTKLVQFLAVKAFQWSEAKEIEYLFENIDPEKIGWGDSVTNYDGVSMPPMILRGETFGFDRTEAHEYRRNRRIVRYYLFDPRGLTGGSTYQLDKLGPIHLSGLQAVGSYYSGNERVQGKTWPLLPNSPAPLGCREYVQDYTPLAQFVLIDVENNTWKSWQEMAANRPIEVQVFDGSQLSKPSEQWKYVVKTRLDRPMIAMQFRHRPYYPKGQQDLPLGVHDQNLLRMRPTLSPGYTPPLLGKLEAGPAGAETYGACALFGLTHSYVLRVVSGKKILDEIPIHFVSKPGAEGWRITGTMNWPESGLCFLRQRHPWMVSQPMAVNPVTDGLLPTKLTVTGMATHGSIDSRTGVLKMKNRNWLLVVKGRLSGQDLKRQWYHAIVQLGSKQYSMWGAVRQDGAAAVMECSVPVPVGRHTITVTVPGVPPAQLVVERAGPQQPPNVNMAELQNRYQQAMQRYRASATDSNRSSLTSALEALSEGYERCEAYEECYKACQAYMQLEPNRQYSCIFLSRLHDASFWMGHAQSTLWAGSEHAERLYGIEARKRLQANSADERGRRGAENTMRLYQQTLPRYVSLGGDAYKAQGLFLKIMEYWALCGYEEEYEPEVVYPHRMIEIGPVTGAQ